MPTEGHQLGRRTLSFLVEYLDHSMTWASLRNFLFRHALDERLQGSSKLSALSNVFHEVFYTQNQQQVRCVNEVLEEITRGLYDRKREIEEESSRTSQLWSDHPRTREELYDTDHQYREVMDDYAAFQRVLRADGLDLEAGRIIPFLSASLDIAKEEGVLELRLKALSLSVPLRHLEQAVDNSARGNWEAANGQVGDFLEGLCEAIAARLFRGPGNPPTHGEARKKLAEWGFLSEKESSLLHALFQVLHGEGRHAGISSEDDCHRRRLIAICMANYYLERLDTWGS